MSALDVEALLDSTASATPDTNGANKAGGEDDRHKSQRSERRDLFIEGTRNRDGDRKRRDPKLKRGDNGDQVGTPTSEHDTAQGPANSRRRSRSRDDDRRHSRRHRDSPDEAGRRDGDFYRGGGRMRSRSRSPNRNSYRPRRGAEEPREDRRNVRSERRKSRSPKREPTPALTEDERDRRTVFVQQLAARLRTKELIAFFEKIGPVKEAQIVKDRVSGRSKGYDNIPSLE